MGTFSTICCKYYFWKFLIPLVSVQRNDTLLIGNLSRGELKLFLKAHFYLSSNKTPWFISIFSKICPISREVPLWQLGNVIRSYKKSRWFQNWFQTRGLYLDFEKLSGKKYLNKFDTMVLSYCHHVMLNKLCVWLDSYFWPLKLQKIPKVSKLT